MSENELSNGSKKTELYEDLLQSIEKEYGTEGGLPLNDLLHERFLIVKELHATEDEEEKQVLQKRLVDNGQAIGGRKLPRLSAEEIEEWIRAIQEQKEKEKEAREKARGITPIKE